jgi:hypothetical protein
LSYLLAWQLYGEESLYMLRHLETAALLRDMIKAIHLCPLQLSGVKMTRQSQRPTHIGSEFNKLCNCSEIWILHFLNLPFPWFYACLYGSCQNFHQNMKLSWNMLCASYPFPQLYVQLSWHRGM